MIRITDPPAGEEPLTRDVTPEPVSNGPTPAQLRATMRALDEALAEARRLRAGLVPPSV
jgi:hypothetical protein